VMDPAHLIEAVLAPAWSIHHADTRARVGPQLWPETYGAMPLEVQQLMVHIPARDCDPMNCSWGRRNIYDGIMYIAGIFTTVNPYGKIIFLGPEYLSHARGSNRVRRSASTAASARPCTSGEATAPPTAPPGSEGGPPGATLHASSITDVALCKIICVVGSNTNIATTVV
jgi:hypothetical protein